MNADFWAIHRLEGARSSKPFRSSDAAMLRALTAASSNVWMPRLNDSDSKLLRPRTEGR
jgi:hypothetical protein